jgi:hypothetical protein
MPGAAQLDETLLRGKAQADEYQIGLTAATATGWDPSSLIEVEGR